MADSRFSYRDPQFAPEDDGLKIWKLTRNVTVTFATNNVSVLESRLAEFTKRFVYRGPHSTVDVLRICRRVFQDLVRETSHLIMITTFPQESLRLVALDVTWEMRRAERTAHLAYAGVTSLAPVFERKLGKLRVSTTGPGGGIVSECAKLVGAASGAIAEGIAGGLEHVETVGGRIQSLWITADGQRRPIGLHKSEDGGESWKQQTVWANELRPATGRHGRVATGPELTARWLPMPIHC